MLTVNDDDTAQHEAESKSDDGGAARGDAALCEQFDDVGKDGVDVFGGVIGALVDAQEFLGEVEGIVERIRSFTSTEGVTTAEAGGWVLSVEAALAAVAIAGLAALETSGNVWFG